jgi:large subunit ribosomal protein L3
VKGRPIAAGIPAQAGIKIEEEGMSIGLVGRKVGMTRIFTDDGGTLPVTVLDVSDNRVTQIKTAENDGYAAVQVSFGKRRATRVNKSLAGHLAKAGVEAGHTLREFRAKAEDLANLKPGTKLDLGAIFKVGQRVDVQGVTIGKGFAGVIKRYHFGGQNASHGNSISHRVPGSTGQNQSPGHVFKGKRMPGHLGNKQRTIANLIVVRVDAERQLLLVKGSVPGSKGRDVIVRPAVKITKTPVAQAKPAAKAEAAPRPAAKPAAKPAAQPAKK